MLQLFDLSTTVLYRLFILAALVIGAGALTFLARWLKVKAEAAKAEMMHELSGSQRFALDTAITIAVQAAQQVVTEKDKRFLYAKELALQAAQSLGIELTDSQLNALIESAVYELKREAAA